MDTMNVPHADNPVGTPTSQCSRPDQERKQPYLSTTSSANAVPSSSTDAATVRSPSATASPPPSCAICLGAFVNKCMPDICMHQFCFNCLLQWSKVKAECPLCKQPFLSIIHNVRSNYEYDEHFIERPPDPEYYLPNAPQPRHFQFRTTFTVDPRGELAIQQMLSSHPLTFPIELGVYNPFTNRMHRHAERAARGPRSERRTYVSTQGYRRTLYEQNLWVVTNQNGADTYREANPEFYRNNEGATTRLVPWLNRELLVLMQNPSSDDVTNLILQILTALPRHHIFSRYMLRDVLQPHLHYNTEHFAHEFYNFMRSPLDMIGYDRSCTHGPRVIENVILDDQSSDDSDISTVLLLDQTQSTASTSSINEAVRLPLHMPTPFASATTANNDIIEIPDSDGPDSDVILQTPPPPTIVDLLHDTSDSDIGTASGKVVVLDQGIAKQHDAGLDTSSVQEVDCLDAGPSTSRGMKRRAINRCTRHDEYMVDRKTVLPLKIRLKRKRHQPSKRSSSKSYQCCKNTVDGYSSSSSNDISLQSRLKRRRKFHKKKYMRREVDSSSDSSSSTSSSRDDPQQQQQTNNSFSSTDDDEPLSSIRKNVKMHQRSAVCDYGQTGNSRSPTKVKTKREGRGHHSQRGSASTSKSTLVPPGVFEPSEPCRSPFFSSPVSSPSNNSQSSRYTPEPVGSALLHRRNIPAQYPLCYFSSQPVQEYRCNYDPVPSHAQSRSHTPPLPARPYSPFMSSVQRRHDYYRSLALPPWAAVGGPSTSAGGARASVSELSIPFAVDSRPHLSYPPQRQHDPMYDPMWNGIRSEHTRGEDDTAAALSLRNCNPN